MLFISIFEQFGHYLLTYYVLLISRIRKDQDVINGILYQFVKGFHWWCGRIYDVTSNVKIYFYRKLTILNPHIFQILIPFWIYTVYLHESIIILFIIQEYETKKTDAYLFVSLSSFISFSMNMRVAKPTLQYTLIHSLFGSRSSCRT